MAWYELKRLTRQPGGPSVGRPENVETFEAQDHLAAEAEAYRRSRDLPSGYFAALCDPDGEVIRSYEAPDRP